MVALVVLAVTTTVLILSEPAQGWRRISSLGWNELHLCRNAATLEIGYIDDLGAIDFTVGVWREPFPPDISTNPPGSISGPHVIHVVPRSAPWINNQMLGAGKIPFTVVVNAGERLTAFQNGEILKARSQDFGEEAVENCLLPSLPSSARMVGKGSVKFGASTASYAFIAGCDTTSTAAGPFEIRWGTHRFRLTEVYGVSCADYSNVLTPLAGFDTQTGEGTGTFDGVPGGAYLQWNVVDGGPDGAGDSAQFSITATGGISGEGTAAPPGKFAGSTQLTGYNTAQAP